MDIVIMNRASRLNPLGGLASLCVVLAALSACSQPDEGAADVAAEAPPVAAPEQAGGDEVTSVDADGNVAPFGMASRQPVEIPPLEVAATETIADAGNQSAEFGMRCAACHGPDAKGVEGLGVNLVESQLVADSSEAELVAFLKVGRLGDSPDSSTGIAMPGFNYLTAEQLTEVSSYLKQL